MSDKYQKLVRDNIPEIIRKNGEKPLVRTLSVREFSIELRKKLVEEAQEAIGAKTKDALIEELADIQEVFLSLCDVEKITPAEVTACAKRKKKLRGGFAKSIFLLGVQ